MQHVRNYVYKEEAGGRRTTRLAPSLPTPPLPRRV